MDKLFKIHRCYHCGAILQDEHPHEAGFITKEILSKYPEGFLLCNKCYQKEKFKNTQPEVPFDVEYLQILDQAKAKEALIIYIVDLLSFEGSIVPSIIEKLKDQNVIVVANKRDLLPPNVSDEKLSEYVYQKLSSYGLKVTNTVLVSSTTGYNIKVLNELILQNGKNKDIYVLGASVSGKSALISALLKEYNNTTNKVIATFPFKGTNLMGMRIPLNSKHYLFETPGTSVDNSISSKVERNIQNQLVPKRAINPRKFNLGEGNSVVLGGLACIELRSKEKTAIDLYCSERVEVGFHKRKAYQSFELSIQREELAPSSSKYTDIRDFDIYDFEISNSEQKDIGIAGLGWFTFKGGNQIFRIYVPKGVFVYVSKSKIEYVNK